MEQLLSGIITTTRFESARKLSNPDPGVIERLLSSGIKGQEEDIPVDELIDATMWEENERR